MLAEQQGAKLGMHGPFDHPRNTIHSEGQTLVRNATTVNHFRSPFSELDRRKDVASPCRRLRPGDNVSHFFKTSHDTREQQHQHSMSDGVTLFYTESYSDSTYVDITFIVYKDCPHKERRC